MDDFTFLLKSVPVQKASVRTDGKATLTFPTKESLDQAAAALEKNYAVLSKSQDKKKLNPKITVTDITPDITTKEELEEELYEKNMNIKDLKEAGQFVKIIFYDTSAKEAVIQVSPEIRDSIRNNGDRIHLSLERHMVKDRIHVIQCYHCQEYGHMSGSNYCKKNGSDATCFFCAGKHSSRDCTVKNNKAKHRCSNCLNSKNSLHRMNAGTHKANDNLCPSYVREKEFIMSRTASCEQTKNEYLQKVHELQKRFGRV